MLEQPGEKQSMLMMRRGRSLKQVKLKPAAKMLRGWKCRALKHSQSSTSKAVTSWDTYTHQLPHPEGFSRAFLPAANLAAGWTYAWLSQGQDFFPVVTLCKSQGASRCSVTVSRGQARSWLLRNRVPALAEGTQKSHTLGTTEKPDFTGREKKPQIWLVNTPKQVSAGCLCPALPESCCLLTHRL